MKEVAQKSRSGYNLVSVHAVKQSYELVPISADTPDSEADLGFGWDWRFADADNFEVAITLEVGATKSRPEKNDLSLAATFRFGTAEDAHSIDLLKFVQFNAVVTLIVFAREIVATTTGRGPYGPLYLPHLNVLDLMGDMDPNDTAGMRQLQKDSALRSRFGILSEPPEPVSDKK